MWSSTPLDHSAASTCRPAASSSACMASERSRFLPPQIRTEVRPWAPGFLTTPIARGTGTCAGDSGGGALLLLQDPQGRGARQLLLGVQARAVHKMNGITNATRLAACSDSFLFALQAAASKPCVDNQAIFVYPQSFADFIVRASRDLGSPIKQTIGWREYS